ncbi:MAG: class I SAM-dependent methyltransferase [Desulfobaccales bacterium]
MKNSSLRKGYKGWGMEGFIAKWYAKTTLKDLKEFKTLAKRIAENLQYGSNVLELAPGPGYLAIELAKLCNYKIVGMDISKTFVEIAQDKAKQAGVAIEFRQGNASNMPFDDETFDLIICRAAFKNFSEPVKALSEIYRVLNANGKALIIDLRRDVPKESINQYVRSLGLSWINSVIIELIFKYMLIKRAYIKEEFEEFILKTEFTKHNISKTLTGLEIWLEK